MKPKPNDDEPRPAQPEKEADTLLVFGKTDDAYAVLRKRGDEVEVGAIRELESGKPIHGQVVRLERRTEHPLLFNVESVTEAPVRAAARSGPAQVATEEYRSGWDAIFGNLGPGTKNALN